MKIEGYTPVKSSFLSIEKDMGIIITELLRDNRLKKLLYYTTPDALDRPNLTTQQTAELMGKNIKNIPKLYVDGSVLNYIIINFDNFVTNATNPEFRDNVVEFDIICHFDQWQMDDFKLRPYRIAAEIDTLLNKKHLTGIGLLEFMGASQIVLTDEFAGICLMYKAYHGEEDKKNMVNPEEEAEYAIDFQDIYGGLK